MKWIETIELRSGGFSDKQKPLDIQGLIDSVPQATRPYRVVVLKNGTISWDTSYHLLFDTPHIELHGSEAGHRLADHLRTRGLINHKIWIETAKIEINING